MSLHFDAGALPVRLAGPALDAKVHKALGRLSHPIPAYSTTVALASEAAIAALQMDDCLAWHDEGARPIVEGAPLTATINIGGCDQGTWVTGRGRTFAEALANVVVHVAMVRPHVLFWRDDPTARLHMATCLAVGEGRVRLALGSGDDGVTLMGGTGAARVEELVRALVEAGFEEVEPGWWKAPSGAR